MTKQDFLKRCNEIMANITDPKRRSANTCVSNKKGHKSREIRAIMKRKVEEQKARKKAREDAQSKS